MISIKNVILENGFSGEEFADLVYNSTGIDKETRLEMMEYRSSERRSGYKDIFYRVNHTSDLLLIYNIGSDISLIGATYKRNYFMDMKGFHNRCMRLSKKYRKFGVSYEFLYAFSDSESTLINFIKRMSNMKKIDTRARGQLLSYETDIEKKREIIGKIIGNKLAKDSRLDTKKPEHIERVAHFIGTAY